MFLSNTENGQALAWPSINESYNILYPDRHFSFFYSRAFVVLLLFSLAFILLHCTVFTVLYCMLSVSA